MALYHRIFRRRISISTRLYFVVGIMGLLIILELLTLRFAMAKLSAVRAFVGGESLWSKAQKDATFSLQRYAFTKDERDFENFMGFLSIPEGDRRARIELSKPNPDLEVVRGGFRQGQIHEEDLNSVIDLLQRFYWVEHLDRAIQAWKAADESLAMLVAEGKSYREAVRQNDLEVAAAAMERIKVLNENLTKLEAEFSSALGEGSRYLENLVLFLLTAAVITVEFIGLSLAIATARSISRGLAELNQAAQKIGAGDFSVNVVPRSNDELGELSIAVNQMGALLQKSYRELEERVRERTSELASMAAENARLYREAENSLRRRDEFLSLASHELKTPITSMLLQAQMQRKIQNSNQDNNKKFSSFIEWQLLRINNLVDEMLDTSRIDLSKLSLRHEEVSLSELLTEVCLRFEPQFQQAGMKLTIDIEPGIEGTFDVHRIEQVITNLFTNALKYAPKKPLHVSLRRVDSNALIRVRDHGRGIAIEDQHRIFGRFERGNDPGKTSGLGIGLYIVRAIAQSHGGEIWINEEVSEGAEFVVTLPLAHLSRENDLRPTRLDDHGRIS